MPIRFDAAKPLSELISVAESLGWRGIQMWQHTFDDKQLVTWYGTSDPKFYLQINEHPAGNVNNYTAAVIAQRYGIRTRWHRFTLADRNSIGALAPRLTRAQFKDRRWRREFAAARPECCIEPPTPKMFQELLAKRGWRSE